MTPDRAALLARVEAFPIDGPDAPALPFAARLARGNGWSRPYADRVVREYKRFAFLAAAGYGPVCPSEDVDAAWHLHLTYTRSYWKRFCGDVLGQPLHHEPTKGGPAEHRKHLAMYAHTLAAYREAFGEPPPADVWTPAGDRFGADLRHRTVNTARNWVIPKKPVVRAAQLTAAFVLVAAVVPGCVGRFKPFELVGADFLGFLIPVMLVALVTGRVLRATQLGPGAHPGDDDLKPTWEQAAYLAGGYPRLVAAAVARLANARVIRPDGERLVRGDGFATGELSPGEQAVLSHLPVSRTDLKTVRDAVAAKFAPEAARLEAEGFVLPEGRRAALGFVTTVPLLLVLLGFGLPRLVMGLSTGKPVMYLVVTLVVGVVLGLPLCFAGLPRLSRRGAALLRRERGQRAALKTAAGADPALAVALFGTAVLAGSGVAFLQTWYPRQAAAGSDGGCGSGCGTGGDGGCGGGGGGGGGGCGGCGGGGD